MPGPPPKSPATRRRRNKKASAAKVTAAAAAVPDLAKPPKLPTIKGRTWHTLTRQWWADVWASPVAGRLLTIDVHELYLLAVLRDDFWKGDVSRANEIRLQRRAFGLTPEDRNRLDWHVSPPAGAGDGDGRRRAEPGRRQDPRAVLSLVKK